MATDVQRPTTQLHYTCDGQGPDVLLIHGWASSGRMWTRLVEALKDRARLWSVDLYGFGASPRPDGNTSVDIDLQLSLLHEFCVQHEIHPRLVIGHSMGGMLALKLAAEYPEFAERLVLLAPVVTGRFGYMLDLNRVFNSDFASLALACSKPFWVLSQNVFMPLFGAPTHWYLDDNATARIIDDYKRSSWQAVAYSIQGIARENLQPCLPKITQPALVVVGSWDTTVPPEESRLAAHSLPNGRLLELARTRHQLLDERPQRVIAAVREMLDQP